MGFTVLNNTSATVATQSNTGTTSVVVGTGQGAAFASASTGNPIRCGVFDTSTSPETLRFYVDVTGRATDTLTVANRGAESTTDANILVGDTLAAVVTAATLAATKGDLLVPSAGGVLQHLAAGADGAALMADSTQVAGLAWKPRTKVIADAHTDVTVVNTTATSALATLALGTDVGDGDTINAFFVGDLFNNSGASVNYTFSFKIGATTALTANAVVAATANVTRTWRVELVIDVVLAASDQRVNADGIINGTGAAGFNLGTSVNSGAGRGTAAEDLTAGKNLIMQVAMGTANSLAQCVLHEAEVILVKR